MKRENQQSTWPDSTAIIRQVLRPSLEVLKKHNTNLRPLRGLAFAMGFALSMLYVASADVPIYFGIDNMIRRIDVLAICQVTDTSSYYTPDSEFILTDVELTVDSVLYGDTTLSVFNLTIPGGTVGDTALYVTGTPFFDIGETTLVFLEIEGGGEFSVFGGLQGQFSVHYDNTLGELIFLGQIHEYGVALLDDATDSVILSRPISDLAPLIADRHFTDSLYDDTALFIYPPPPSPPGSNR